MAKPTAPILTRLPNGDPNIRRIGIPRDRWRDIYYFILMQKWGAFYALLIAFYVIVNCGFATLYWMHPGCIAEAHPGRWIEDFFFSFETLATVGFGVMHPVSTYAHWVVTSEIMVAVLALPLLTGLTIVKFARPHARVTFSNNAVITNYDGVPTLMFRLANLRASQIFEAHINLTLLRRETTLEGHTIRRLVTLDPVRATQPMFILSWTVMHRIDETSPLYGVNWLNLPADELDLLAVMTGLDATTSATVYARHLYTSAEILPGVMFNDIILTDSAGRLTIDYRRLHDLAPVSDITMETDASD
jgi:inward rectifier potassium channel